MEDQLNAIVAEAKSGVDELASRADFDAYKAQYVGPKGALTQFMKGIGKLHTSLNNKNIK